MPQQGPERFPVITPVLLIPVCPGSIGADPNFRKSSTPGVTKDCSLCSVPPAKEGLSHYNVIDSGGYRGRGLLARQKWQLCFRPTLLPSYTFVEEEVVS